MFQCFLGQCTGSKFNTLKKLQKHTDTYHSNHRARFNADKDCPANEKWECTYPQCNYKSDRDARVSTHYDRLHMHIRLKQIREARAVKEEVKRKKREDEMKAWDIQKLEEYCDAMAEDMKMVKRMEALIEEVEDFLGPEIIAEGISRREIVDKGN
jgi:hypothetical protein